MGGVKIEAPKAPRGGVGEGVSPSPLGKGSGEGDQGCAPSPEKFCIFYIKITPL